MQRISDDFLKSIMSDSAKLHSVAEEKIEEQKMQLAAIPKDIKSSVSEGSKAYLIEQIISLERQISHLKEVIGRM